MTMQISVYPAINKAAAFYSQHVTMYEGASRWKGVHCH